MQLTAAQAMNGCQKACKPDRGIETVLPLSHLLLTMRGQKACKPDRGIETLRSRWQGIGFLLVRRPVSPIAGLKPLSSLQWHLSKKRRKQAHPEAQTRKRLWQVSLQSRCGLLQHRNR